MFENIRLFLFPGLSGAQHSSMKIEMYRPLCWWVLSVFALFAMRPASSVKLTRIQVELLALFEELVGLIDSDTMTNMQDDASSANLICNQIHAYVSQQQQHGNPGLERIVVNYGI
jgi:hypothetical protein